jgi:hypothetical protein
LWLLGLLSRLLGLLLWSLELLRLGVLVLLFGLLLEPLPGLFELFPGLLHLSLTFLLLGTCDVLQPLDTLFRELLSFFSCLLQEIHVVIETLFRQIGVLALGPVVHIDEILDQFGDPFLELHKLGKRHLCRFPHRLHILDEWLCVGLCVVRLVLLVVTHCSIVYAELPMTLRYRQL